jgi:hypothetical protein
MQIRFWEVEKVGRLHNKMDSILLPTGTISCKATYANFASSLFLVPTYCELVFSHGKICLSVFEMFIFPCDKSLNFKNIQLSIS